MPMSFYMCIKVEYVLHMRGAYVANSGDNDGPYEEDFRMGDSSQS
jgi:hypothetical protein